MARIILPLAVIAAILAEPARAQPFSKSMAECAGLYAFGRDYVEGEDAVFLFEFGQAKRINAAVVQAQDEGVSNPASYVDAAMTSKYDEWRAQGALVVFTEEFGDRMDYCRAFGAAQGIDLDPA